MTKNGGNEYVGEISKNRTQKREICLNMDVRSRTPLKQILLK